MGRRIIQKIGKKMTEFNVRDYGAVGDEKTDDNAAVQRAFNAAALSGGGKVHFPPGIYRLSRPLRLKKKDKGIGKKDKGFV